MSIIQKYRKKRNYKFVSKHTYPTCNIFEKIGIISFIIIFCVPILIVYLISNLINKWKNL